MPEMNREQVIKNLRRLKVQTGSLACIGCECEDGCSINGCAIIGDAIRLLSVSSLETSQQAADSVEQSTEKHHQGTTLVV